MTNQKAPHLMFFVGILGDAAEERERQGALDIVMAVDGGRNARHDALPDALVLAEGRDGAYVLVCHAGCLAALVLPETIEGVGTSR